MKFLRSRASRAIMIGLALVLPSGALLAQTTLSGRVSEVAGGAGLAAAQVTIVGTTIGAVTNAEGRFRLRGVPTGAVTVLPTTTFHTAATRRPAKGNQSVRFTTREPVVACRSRA